MFNLEVQYMDQSTITARKTEVTLTSPLPYIGWTISVSASHYGFRTLTPLKP